MSTNAETKLKRIINARTGVPVHRFPENLGSSSNLPESRKFWIGFKYNFGNYSLRENKKTISTKEGDRLQ